VKHRLAYVKISIAILIAVLASCNNTNFGIYQSIVDEERIVDGSLPNTVSVFGLVNFGDDVYIAGNAMYRKDFSQGTDSDWSKRGAWEDEDREEDTAFDGFLPSVDSFYDMVLRTSTEAWALGYDADGAGDGSGAPVLASFDSALSATTIDFEAAFGADLEPVAIAAANDILFVLVRDTTGLERDLFYTYDGSIFAEVDATATFFGNKLMVAYDSVGLGYLASDGMSAGTLNAALVTYTESSGVEAMGSRPFSMPPSTTSTW
jgi:hypothetical protein